ncbi:MAG TPA: IclR family transcriptional regulator [Bryobacteraceae bacterium]|nr:IclR family transcriptional regulator [Bryobacteraceae bacterium]
MRTANGAVSQETPPIQSLDRGLIILEAVAKSNHPVSLADLTSVLGIDRSSVFRLANTLKRRGFLAYPTGRKDYILGPTLWRLSHLYDWGTMLVRVSHEHLKQLASQTNETAHLAIREGKHALFVDHATASHMISVSGQTGEMVPLYCTAHGKALLADLDLKELESLFGPGPLRCYTSRTISGVPQLATVCAQIKAQSFATDDGEFTEGIRCVAAPIRAESGMIIGSIGISAPLQRFPEERYQVGGAQVRAVASQISAQLVTSEA